MQRQSDGQYKTAAALGMTAGQVYGDATILFPLLVAETFAKEFHHASTAGKA